MNAEFLNPVDGQSCAPEQFVLRELGDVACAQESVVQRMLGQGYGNRDVFGVRLALEEALTNAILHGNGGDPAKQVRVAYHVDPTRVWIQIEDEGQGFSPDAICDPTQPHNIERPNGRGLLFIRQYMNSVEFNALGNGLTMLKQRSFPTDDISPDE